MTISAPVVSLARLEKPRRMEAQTPVVQVPEVSGRRRGLSAMRAGPASPAGHEDRIKGIASLSPLLGDGAASLTLANLASVPFCAVVADGLAGSSLVRTGA